jgi:hypothetical protein
LIIYAIEEAKMAGLVTILLKVAPIDLGGNPPDGLSGFVGDEERGLAEGIEGVAGGTNSLLLDNIEWADPAWFGSEYGFRDG